MYPTTPMGIRKDEAAQGTPAIKRHGVSKSKIHIERVREGEDCV